MKSLILIGCLLVSPFFWGQLTTSTALSPQLLVQNVLTGPGVQVSNVKYTGDLQAIGQFNYTGNLLGLNKGIVITTGTVFNNGQGPHGPNNDGSSGINNSGDSSAILNNILGSNSTFNAATLEFDFIAIGDIVSFKYVFGSEEYLEYVGKGFNDLFGLFISGPGLTGNQNIAKLPNQTIVSIDNVNNTSNSSFYVNNGTGNNGPFNSSSQYIQYDGYTKVLTAQSPVQCGQQYHLTIAIADVGDGILDSGIFLEAQSLKSDAPTSVDFQASQVFYNNPNVLAEGCTSGDFVFSRIKTDQALTVNLTVSGTAQNTLDYTNTIPSSLTLNVGQSSASFSFDAILDAISEVQESIIIEFQYIDECSGANKIIIDTVFIRDVDPIKVTLANDSIFCDGSKTVTLIPIVTGGLEPITYQWNTQDISSSITVSPPTTSTYTVTVTDFCLNSTASASAEVFIPTVPPIVIDPIPDVQENCPFTPISFTGNATGGNESFTYQWENTIKILSSNNPIIISPAATDTFLLIATDRCGFSDSISFIYEVLTKLLIPEINTPIPVCPGDSVLLSASATLGYGNYKYAWDHSEETTPSVWVNPLITTSYTVRISDDCQTYTVPIKTKVPVFEPVANFSVSTADLILNAQIQFIDASKNGVSFFWDLGNGQTSTEKNPSTSYGAIGDYDVMLIMTDNLGCIDTLIRTISIGTILYIPNTFTPDGNRYNNFFFAQSYNIQVLSIEIFNRWGELVFEELNNNYFTWDGSYKGKKCPDGTYTYVIKYKNSQQEEFVKTGHVNLLR